MKGKRRRLNLFWSPRVPQAHSLLESFLNKRLRKPRSIIRQPKANLDFSQIRSRSNNISPGRGFNTSLTSPKNIRKAYLPQPEVPNTATTYPTTASTIATRPQTVGEVDNDTDGRILKQLYLKNKQLQQAAMLRKFDFAKLDNEAALYEQIVTLKDQQKALKVQLTHPTPKIEDLDIAQLTKLLQDTTEDAGRYSTNLNRAQDALADEFELFFSDTKDQGERNSEQFQYLITLFREEIKLRNEDRKVFDDSVNQIDEKLADIYFAKLEIIEKIAKLKYVRK